MSALLETRLARVSRELAEIGYEVVADPWSAQIRRIDQPRLRSDLIGIISPQQELRARQNALELAESELHRLQMQHLNRQLRGPIDHEKPQRRAAGRAARKARRKHR